MSSTAAVIVSRSLFATRGEADSDASLFRAAKAVLRFTRARSVPLAKPWAHEECAALLFYFAAVHRLEVL